MESSSPDLLAGYRVLDLSMDMGAMCGRLLRDLGMEVIKIEPPTGDPLRLEPPFAKGKSQGEGSIRFAYLNAGKRGVTLDLTGAEGRKCFLDLVEKSDVVLESHAPGILDGWNLGFEALSKRQPKIILASISGFGQSGPYRNYLSPDIVTTAMGGLLYISGDPNMTPCMPPGTQSYYYASLCAAYAVVLALWQREKNGRGIHIDTSVQASIALHEHVAFTYSAEGRVMKRAGSQHQHAAPANLFPCQDGFLSLFVTQRHWPLFLEIWENHPPELDDPKLNSNAARHSRTAWLNPLVASFTSQYKKEELAHMMQKRGLPALAVNSPSDFLGDRHIQERGFFGRVTHPVLGTFQQPSAPFMVEGKRVAPSIPPLLGEHNTEIFNGGLKSSDKEPQDSAVQDAFKEKSSTVQSPSTNRILQGIRVLAFTTGYAGPYAGRFLAQYGAEVIKVESMKGGLDSFRHYGQSPSIDGAPRFIECNLGVRSLAVNLKHPVGAKILRELARHCDAVLVNFRPGVLQRLGLGDEDLKKENPKIIILKLPGLGESGPKYWYGSWGFNLTAFSGMTYLWNHPGQPRPIGSQGVYPDHVGFVLAPMVLVAALHQRTRTGRGVSIDLAQAEATAYTMGPSYLEAGINGEDPVPQGNHDGVAAPQGCYRCRGEDRWCVVSVRSDEQWHTLCQVMGKNDWIADPRFADPKARSVNAKEIDVLIEQWTTNLTAEEVTEKLQAAGVPAGVVKSAADLLKDPQLRSRNYFEQFSESLIGPFELPRSPFTFLGMKDDPLSLPSPLGKDTDSILRGLLGYDDETISQWREEEILT
ncbi:MAG: hypothetical protein GTO40_27870 [Deltaproteobacteria bacterium]|nr:hypothetical protein [Deltaproteobacteria bacterium]